MFRLFLMPRTWIKVNRNQNRLMRYPRAEKIAQTIPCPGYTIPFSVEGGAFHGDGGFSKLFQKSSLGKPPSLPQPNHPEKIKMGGEGEGVEKRAAIRLRFNTTISARAL